MDRVLLIETNPTHARLVIERLHSVLKDVHLDFAGSYQRTLTLLQKHSYHCIVTEVSVPDFQGDSLILSLKQVTPRTPLVVITGRGDAASLSELYHQGADECLLKTRDSLDTMAHLIWRTILKHRWQTNPLIRPAQVLGKVISGMEKTVSRRVKRFGQKAHKLIRKKRR